MNIQQTNSGLLLATDKPLPPPVHPVRAAIRMELSSLSVALDNFEQTTHGRLGPNTLEDALQCLLACWKSPSAYTVSEAAQALWGFSEADHD